jgi:hypothetical protein
MEQHECNILEDIIKRADSNWENCTYTDKINLIKICKKFRREIVEDILPQIDRICEIPIEYVELEEVYKLFKGGLTNECKARI